MTSLRTALTAGVLATALAGGGIGWGVAAASSAGRSGQAMTAGGMPMMGGQPGGAMGEFSQDEPFDLQFIDQMTAHHRGALMSTEAMIADSDRPELRQLAAAIESSQTAQIEQMQAWRAQWYGDVSSTAGGMAADQMGQMSTGAGMSVMPDMMGGSGEDMYLQMMIAHHQLGVDMAGEALTRSGRPEIRQLAGDIADEQSAQILLMRAYLADG